MLQMPPDASPNFLYPSSVPDRFPTVHNMPCLMGEHPVKSNPVQCNFLPLLLSCASFLSGKPSRSPTPSVSSATPSMYSMGVWCTPHVGAFIRLAVQDPLQNQDDSDPTLGMYPNDSLLPSVFSSGMCICCRDVVHAEPAHASLSSSLPAAPQRVRIPRPWCTPRGGPTTFPFGPGAVLHGWFRWCWGGGLVRHRLARRGFIPSKDGIGCAGPCSSTGGTCFCSLEPTVIIIHG
jgi:hypothetical protein